VHKILFQDPDLLVVAKPPGMLTIPERFDTGRPVLSELLKKEHGQVWTVHRLDEGTSGVMVFALSEAAHRSLSMQFEEHTVQKTYWALVKGCPAKESGEIDLPLSENPRKPGRMQVDREGGKPAQSSYRVVEKFKSGSLVEVLPRTGRTHQIRVHMAAISCPLLFDPIYGSTQPIYLSQLKRGYKPNRGEEERPIMDRLTLHALKLELTHPTSQERVTFEAELPKDLSVLLKHLRRY